MKTKEKKFLFGLPSWGLSLLTALLALIFLLFLGSIVSVKLTASSLDQKSTGLLILN